MIPGPDGNMVGILCYLLFKTTGDGLLDLFLSEFDKGIGGADTIGSSRELIPFFQGIKFWPLTGRYSVGRRTCERIRRTVKGLVIEFR